MLNTGIMDDLLENDNYMKCDIYEENEVYYIEMDLPGFKRENLSIEFNSGYLTVMATKKDINDDKKNFIKRERTFGIYKRQFYIGNVDYSKINARYKDGTLIISVVKAKDEKSKKNIEIK